MQIPNTSEESLLPTSLSTVQSHKPNKKFFVAIVALVTVTFYFHYSALSCFLLNETFYMLQQQVTLYFRFINLVSHVKFQKILINRSCRQGRTCELTLLNQCLLGTDCFNRCDREDFEMERLFILPNCLWVSFSPEVAPHFSIS